MKAHVYSIDGKVAKDIELPAAFSEPVRDDLIYRAVLSDESRTYQPKGNYRFAGFETSARYVGRKEIFGSLKNKGQAMLPREVLAAGGTGKVKRIPSAVKGHRAHPPKPETKIVEEMNKKEYAKALRSALAATASASLVEKRHGVKIASAPIVIEDKFESVSKTKDVLGILKHLNLSGLVEKSKDKTKRKTGVRSRVRTTKVPKAALIVVSEKSKVLKSARNLSGVDVVTPKELKVRHLAPGTKAGRVTVYSEGALKEIAGMESG
ncbi:MAG: 50S ribosomal protein L4 [Candidatus Bilamarchaeaceae archaeon]